MLIANHGLGSDKVPVCSPESLIERVLTASGRIFLEKEKKGCPCHMSPACSNQQHAGFVNTGT